MNENCLASQQIHVGNQNKIDSNNKTACDALDVTHMLKFGDYPLMGLACRTPTRFMPATDSWIAQGNNRDDYDYHPSKKC